MAAMSPTRKRIAMLIVAVGGALLVQRVVALASDDAGEVIGVAKTQRARNETPSERSAAPAAAASAAATSVQLDRLATRRAPASSPAGQSTAVLFDNVSWLPPPPKVAAAPPPKPVAPPFPYAYIGGLSEDGVRTSFFQQGERVLPVKAGDTVDAAYRVDLMTEKKMTLTYLPLNETLDVALGGGR